MVRFEFGPCWTWVALCLVATGGCGGGGGSSDAEDLEAEPLGELWTAPPAPPADPGPGAVVEGVFKDASVAGLTFESGGQSGVTGADGVFRYEAGTDVTFRIGGVEYGRATGQPFMTPLNLLLPSSIGGPLQQQIDNRLRFLQALDRDGDPGNGIEISAAVRAAAESWPQVDFTATDLDGAVQPLLDEAAAVDGVPHVLPSASAANAHFVAAARCAYSGLYRGSFSGDDSGVFALTVDPVGRIFGMAYSNVERAGVLFENTSALALSIFPRFTAEAVSAEGSYSGRFDSTEVMSGSWTSNPDSGTFVGLRSNGARSAVYRLSGHKFPAGTALLLTVEIDAADRVRGAVIDLDDQYDGEPEALDGTIAGTQLSAESANFELSGTFDRAVAADNLRLTGTLVDRRKSRNVALTDVNGGLPGCRLN